MGRKFVVIFSTIILILCFSSCFAATTTSYSLTFNEFKEIIEAENLTLDSSVTASTLSEALANRPLVINDIYYQGNYEKYLAIYMNYTNSYCYAISFSDNNARLYRRDSIVNEYSNYGAPVTTLLGYNSDNVLHYVGQFSNNYNVINYANYENYQTDMTLTEFKTFSAQKKILGNKVLFYKDGIYFQKTESDLMYKFDGIFKGNTSQKPYTSSFKTNNDMFRFEYTAYTDLTDSNVVNYFYLQEFTPSEAVNLTDEDLKFTDSDEQIVMNQKLESNFSYTSLIRRMQEGYIYRLYCFSNQHDSNGDLIRTTDSTSCFFSLNSWKSNLITVLNIYELVFPENLDIEQEGGTSGGVTDLENIQNSINDLNNNITTVPDVSNTTITSGEITDALDFEFAEDPYANFWLELTTGLSGALTNNVRSIDVQFRNKTYKIELDKFAIQTPEFLKSFLAILSTVFIFWKMIKYWKIIIDNITSGNMDEVLEMNEEERNY